MGVMHTVASRCRAARYNSRQKKKKKNPGGHYVHYRARLPGDGGESKDGLNMLKKGARNNRKYGSWRLKYAGIPAL